MDVLQEAQIFDAFFTEISAEFQRAKKYPPFNSTHEAYAVIKEELDEFWDEVKKSKDAKLTPEMGKELIQVAAMCIKALMMSVKE